MMRSEKSNGDRFVAKIAIIAIVVFIGLTVAAMWGWPHYNVWQQGLSGEAELRRAEQNRKITVQEAQAKHEASKSLAQAEVERAKGVAEANRIIGESLQGREEYLHYLWIHALETTAQQGDKVIYVPTEANMPILEAGRVIDKK